MNASFAALTGALLIFASPWAQAASLSNNGQVDYGKFSAQDLNPLDGSTTFELRHL